MAKVSRLISLEYELNEKLGKEDNASKLISELLDGHYNTHLSNDLGFLKNQQLQLDNKIKLLQANRNLIHERVSLIKKKTIENQKVIEVDKEKEKEEKELTYFLSDKVKKREITFEEFRDIRKLDNWKDCIIAVRDNKLDLMELINKIKVIKDKFSDETKAS